MEEIPEQEKSVKEVNPVVTVLCYAAFFLVWFVIIFVQAASMCF
jgi:hypothetical protein